MDANKAIASGNPAEYMQKAQEQATAAAQIDANAAIASGNPAKYIEEHQQDGV